MQSASVGVLNPSLLIKHYNNVCVRLILIFSYFNIKNVKGALNKCFYKVKYGSERLVDNSKANYKLDRPFFLALDALNVTQYCSIRQITLVCQSVL